MLMRGLVAFSGVGLVILACFAGCDGSDPSSKPDATEDVTPKAIPTNNPSAKTLPEPQLDVLAGDFEATSAAYYSQHFRSTATVQELVAGLAKLERLYTATEKAQAQLKGYQELTGRESTSLLEDVIKTMDEYLEYVQKGDTFAFREMFRFSACRLCVAQSRFDYTKKILNQANSSQEMAAAKFDCERQGAILKREMMLFGLLRGTLKDAHLETSDDEHAAGLRLR